jgi:hypothetical protein
VNAAFQPVDRPAHDFELRVIVSGERGFTLRFQLANASLDIRLIDADHIMMFVLNAKSFSERPDQVLFVHLRVALDGFVIASFRDFAQIGKRLVFQFFDCVCHS